MRTVALVAVCFLCSCTDEQESIGALTAEVTGSSYRTVTTSYQLPTGGSAGILIYEPVVPSASLPLFIWVHGTGEDYQDPISRRILASFAQRGIVAASVGYTNGYVQGHSCAIIEPKARAIFDSSYPQSAVRAIERAVLKTDTLGRGLIVAGFSQGSNIAALAPLFHSEVRGAWLLATGVTLVVARTYDLSCTAAQTTGLIAIRAVNGIHDEPDGGGYRASSKEKEQANRVNLQEVTDICPGCSGLAASRPDGSGWALVEDAAITDGLADHFYFYKTPITPEPDPNWDTTTASWGRQYNVNWLIDALD